jgi:hypothetical protein
MSSIREERKMTLFLSVEQKSRTDFSIFCRTKVNRMLTGYNTDIKHEGIVYHVQTEDGGTDNPVIVSLVYKGGRILVSKKTSYAQLLGTDDFMSKLRDLLERQHKTMIKAILTGNLVANGARLPTIPSESPVPASQPPSEPVPQPAPVVAEPAPPEPPAQPAQSKPPIEVPQQPASPAAPDPAGEKNLDQVILEYLASEIDND